MKAPGTAYDDPVLGKDPQPAHMNDYVITIQDNGGVHINSGIPNHAFYLVAAALHGYAWERAGRIWYETLRDSRLRPNTGFRRFARLTTATAERLYGDGSVEHRVVREAWVAVGVVAA
jgi:Zn-dependent metalloprotease